MYFLGVCQNVDILRVIYFVRQLLNIVFMIIPIALIILLIIDVAKMMITPDEKNSKDLKKIINRVVFSCLIFFVPTIVNVVTNLLQNAGISGVKEYTNCIVNTNSLQTINAIEYQQQINKQMECKEAGNENCDEIEIDRPETNPGDAIGVGGYYSNLASEMILTAGKEIGYTEEAPTSTITENNNKYGAYFSRNGLPWCAMFVKWVAKNTEVNGENLFDDIINKERLITFESWDWAIEPIYVFNNSENLKFYYSKSYGGNYIPKRGDYIFFNFNKPRWNKKIYKGMHDTGDHVGIVSKVNLSTGSVTVIEGNAGLNHDKVVEVTYILSNDKIMGYGSWYEE